ncbi:hypothetical protein LNTAR_09159 [Lentisphaera araneosa HTCC2155]|uniref:HTH araC/xylS-type domain-containing protein n=1 Tax=Lentisphaera araneosa HTCC2155 TaxID=313628 RepID=A6DI73_9BACT|nr:AraC family transcriptional regulator [Lentisphaera araneosa]EDM28727.1 hypothetical protein LNTAR_09159 [Lentisphaera araneosa HTCC2155]
MNILSEKSTFYSSKITYNQKSSLGPRVQNNLQFVWVKKGKIHLSINKKQIIIDKGEFIFLFPNRQEFFVFDEGTEHSWIDISSPNKLDHTEIEFKVMKASSFMHKCESLLGHKQSISCKEQSTQAFVHRAFICEAIDLLLERKKNPAYTLHVQKAIDYCKENLSAKLDSKILAQHAGLSPIYLSKLFNNELGLSCAKYILQLRCDEAEKLLLNTGISSAEIAFQCGFATPNHFSRIFSQQKGQSPGKYRKSHWGQ